MNRRFNKWRSLVPVVFVLVAVTAQAQQQPQTTASRQGVSVQQNIYNFSA